MNPVLMIPIAYLVGSIPFSYLIGRARGIDIRAHGSGNPGATNLGRVLGGRFFVAGFALDMTKGLTPTLLTGWLLGTLGTMRVEGADAWIWLGVMGAAVLGHMFTPWLGFKGGKGVATGLGAMLGIMPAMTVPAVGALVVFGVTLMLWRMVGVASPVAAASLPLWVHLTFAQYETVQERRIASTPALRRNARGRRRRHGPEPRAALLRRRDRAGAARHRPAPAQPRARAAWSGAEDRPTRPRTGRIRQGRCPLSARRGSDR